MGSQEEVSRTQAIVIDVVEVFRSSELITCQLRASLKAHFFELVQDP